MAERDPGEQAKGLSDALREAVERTFAATAGSASETRERAGELLDEVARRGTDAREAVDDARRAVLRRGQEASRAPRAMAQRFRDAVRVIRRGSPEEVEELRAEVERLRAQVAELERRERSRRLLQGQGAPANPDPPG
jgi:polyhydroxyalkanoate synthesis regulator phasin